MQSLPLRYLTSRDRWLKGRLYPNLNEGPSGASNGVRQAEYTAQLRVPHNYYPVLVNNASLAMTLADAHIGWKSNRSFTHGS